jgi:hypothetical protein
MERANLLCAVAITECEAWLGQWLTCFGPKLVALRRVAFRRAAGVFQTQWICASPFLVTSGHMRLCLDCRLLVKGAGRRHGARLLWQGPVHARPRLRTSPCLRSATPQVERLMEPRGPRTDKGEYSV